MRFAILMACGRCGGPVVLDDDPGWRGTYAGRRRERWVCLMCGVEPYGGPAVSKSPPPNPFALPQELE